MTRTRILEDRPAAPRGRAHLRRMMLGLMVALTCACAPIFRNHGYVPDEAELALLEVGVDTRDSVGATIGRPSAAGLLNDEGWYYVQSRWRHYGGRAPQEVEREVLAISFSPEGVLTNIERFGLEDGRVVALSRRVTESNIKGVGLIGQLLGSIGRLSADQILN